MFLSNNFRVHREAKVYPTSTFSGNHSVLSEERILSESQESKIENEEAADIHAPV